jgi:prevent-host-death family protein
MMIWQLQEAKSKFSQIVNRALREGPLIVTRHGQEVVVVLSVEEYRKMIESRPTLLDLLLNSPLAGSELEIVRDQEDYGRNLSL